MYEHETEERGTTRNFATMWAEATLRQADRVEVAIQADEAAARWMDKADDYYRAEREAFAAWRAAWAETHLLIDAANQFEQWAGRLLRLDGRELAGVEGLKTMRNAVLHLSDALLTDTSARPDPHLKRKYWAIDDLPGGELPLVSFGSRRLFGLIDIEELRAGCNDLLGEFDAAEMAEAEDLYTQRVIDERRGK